jgi:hypothetical protein
MKKLNDQRLEVGDIILTSGSNKVSKAVRRATNSDISHAMIHKREHVQGSLRQRISVAAVRTASGAAFCIAMPPMIRNV